jgi:hypothetical protein
MKTAEDWECMARLRRREVLNRHRAESFGAFLVSYRRECGRLSAFSMDCVPPRLVAG